jgi:hypothetical protein
METVKFVKGVTLKPKPQSEGGYHPEHNRCVMIVGYPHGVWCRDESWNVEWISLEELNCWEYLTEGCPRQHRQSCGDDTAIEANRLLLGEHDDHFPEAPRG